MCPEDVKEIPCQKRDKIWSEVWSNIKKEYFRKISLQDLKNVGKLKRACMDQVALDATSEKAREFALNVLTEYFVNRYGEKSLLSGQNTENLLLHYQLAFRHYLPLLKESS